MKRRSFLAIPALAALAPKYILAACENTTPLTLELLEQIGDEMLPADHKCPPFEDYEQLLKDLQRRAVNTVSALKQIITNQLPKVLEEEQEKIRRHGFSSNMVTPECITKQRWQKKVFYLHVGLIRLCCGDTSWYISENDEVEEGRLISREGNRSCYLNKKGEVHFAQPNSSFHSFIEAQSEFLYRQGLVKKT